MKLIRWPLTLSLLFLVWSSLAVGDVSTAQSVPEQLEIVAQVTSSHIQGMSHLGVGWEIWAEWLWLPRRHHQRRNPLRRLQRLMRLAARRQRRKTRAVASQEAAAALAPAGEGQAAQPFACAQDMAYPIATPFEPIRRRGRRPTVPTNHVFCPQKTCRGYGRVGPDPNHWIVGAGTYTTKAGGRRQMYQCQWCKTLFSETQGTVFFGLKTPQETIYRALKALAEGVGIRATARIFDVEADTVLLWLRRAGEHSQQVSAYLMRNLKVEQAQLDELWTFVHKKEKALSAWEKLHTEYGDTWVWIVFDPLNKLVLAILIGEHEEEQAVGVLSYFKACLVENCLPLLTSDQLPHYLQAILRVFGRWVQPQRKGKRGRHPKPRLEPPEGLQYATVNKKRRKGRVVAVTTKIVYGNEKEIQSRLQAATPGTKINTSFVERMNLTLRHLVSRLRRRGLTFSKKQAYLEWHMHLVIAYYHLVRPHGSLRCQLPEPTPTRGNGSPKKWEQHTPAMAGGLTNHVWTMEELLMFRVPLVTVP